MLLRMYMRFAEQRGWKAELIDRQDGEEAGLKSATLHVVGDHAYGYLKGEMGVHRLVRISPVRLGAAPAHVLRVGLRRARDRRGHRDRDRRQGPPRRHLPLERRRRPARQRHGLGRAHHPPADAASSSPARTSAARAATARWRCGSCSARLYQRALDERRAEEEKRVGEKKAIEWGSQIRSYVLHPYRMVKDHRTGFEIGRHRPRARRRPDAVHRGVPQVGGRRAARARAVLTAERGRRAVPWMDELAERLARAASAPRRAAGRASAARRCWCRSSSGTAALLGPPDAPHRDRRAPPRADLVSRAAARRRTTRPPSHTALRETDEEIGVARRRRPAARRALAR